MSGPEASQDPDVAELPVESGLVSGAAPALDASEEAATSQRADIPSGEVAAEEAASLASDIGAETAKAFAEARDRLQEATAAGLEHGQGMLDQFGLGRDQLTAHFGSSLTEAPAQLAAFNAKALEAWQSNAGALMAHWQDLLRVSSWSELIALNAEHTRKQMEAMTAQAKEFSALVGTMTKGANEPHPGTKHDGGIA